MSNKRQSLSNKLRFEIFKRDSFTCQYCGGKSPDVLLEVDHINPVSKGGDNNIINLVTSCKTCNSGKSDKVLSDQTVLEKQRKQLEELEERRSQLEMMMKWQHGLLDERDRQVDAFIEYFNKANDCDVSLTDTGIKKIKTLIKKYGYQKVIQAADDVSATYDYLAVEERINKLSGVISYSLASEDDKKIMYINGILRNRFNKPHERDYQSQLIRSVIGGYKYEYLLDIAKNARNWYDWVDAMQSLANPEDH